MAAITANNSVISLNALAATPQSVLGFSAVMLRAHRQNCKYTAHEAQLASAL